MFYWKKVGRIEDNQLEYTKVQKLNICTGHESLSSIYNHCTSVLYWSKKLIFQFSTDHGKPKWHFLQLHHNRWVGRMSFSATLGLQRPRQGYRVSRGEQANGSMDGGAALPSMTKGYLHAQHVLGYTRKGWRPRISPGVVSPGQNVVGGKCETCEAVTVSNTM